MKICDAHNDFLTEIKFNVDKKKYIKKIIKNRRIKLIACIIWSTHIKNPLTYINNNICNVFNNKLNKKFILCIEDLGFINENNYLIILSKIFELKPFSCGLVWNSDNCLGGGAFGTSGLTKLGKTVVELLESNGIIIDTAHMNRKTFWQFCRITCKPIYNSHCNLCYFKNHKRNLTDKQIEKIVESNGFIGFSFVCDFIFCNNINCEIIAKQIGYFINKYGVDYIGIGSDFYGTKNLPNDLSNYSNFINLKKALHKEGVTKQNINKIFYENFYKFVTKNKS